MPLQIVVGDYLHPGVGKVMEVVDEYGGHDVVVLGDSGVKLPTAWTICVWIMIPLSSQINRNSSATLCASAKQVEHLTVVNGIIGAYDGSKFYST